MPKFKTQGEMAPRAVMLSNLYAMCERVSGVCHRYAVARVSKTRCYVEYSNPDEYGNESPMTAAFPLLPNDFEPSNPYVVIGHMASLTGDNQDGEGWQSFHVLVDCPQLWRSGPDSDDWLTREEIEASRAVKES